MSLRVHIQVPIGTSAGYHNDGIGLTRAFLQAGSYVTLQPVSVITPIPEDIAKVLTHEPDYPFDLFINHVDPGTLEIPENVADKAWRKIGWTMWEWDSFGPNTERVRKNLEGYDFVLGYDDTSVKALKDTGTTTPIYKLQGGYEPDLWSEDNGEVVERDWYAEEFVFVIAGDLTPRKNPYVLCRALKSLYEEGYKFKLIIKNKVAEKLPPMLEQAYPFIEIHNGTWPQPAMKQLYESAHCYVGPSNGEGKNLPALEAGTTGAALILSDVAGHREWAREEFTKFVGGVINRYDAGCGSLRVDEVELREACRDLMDNRFKAKQMGDLAHKIIPASCSWANTIRRLQAEYLTRI